VVALGAAIQAAALTDEKHEVLLLDVTPHSLGIMIVGGYFHKLIEQNTTVPTSKSHVFTTVKDNQTSVKILVLQGESDRAEENELLGEFVLTGLRRAPRGEVEIEVTFHISADGIVSVTARDLETGLEQSITVTATSGLTEDELRRWSTPTRTTWSRCARARSSTRRATPPRRCSTRSSAVPAVSEIISGSDFGQDAIKKARSVVERVRSAIAAKDLAGLTDATEALSRTLNMFRGVVSKTAG
jgi:molecular chaperone DnaK